MCEIGSLVLGNEEKLYSAVDLKIKPPLFVSKHSCFQRETAEYWYRMLKI